MFGFIMYLVAFLIYTVAPLSIIWVLLFLIGVLAHWKWWLAGIGGFLVGLNWKSPLN